MVSSLRHLVPLGCFWLFLLVLSCGGSASGGVSTAVPTATRTGPTISVNPKSAPPGSRVTITGSGWPAGADILITAGDASASPYTTAVADRSGGFRESFFLETLPDGGSLETGRLGLFAVSGDIRVELSFLVEVRRPVSGPGPGGG